MPDFTSKQSMSRLRTRDLSLLLQCLTLTWKFRLTTLTCSMTALISSLKLMPQTCMMVMMRELRFTFKSLKVDLPVASILILRMVLLVMEMFS